MREPAAVIEVPGAAGAQGGVFTAAQALDDGLSRRQVQRRLERGRWVRLPAGALAPADVERTPELLARGVRLVWPEAVTCLRTAAALWALPVEQDGHVHVHAAAGRRARGVRVLRPAAPAASTVPRDAGLATTTFAATISDCLGLLPLSEALDLVAWLLTRRRVDRAAISWMWRERYGRRGAPQLERILRLTVDGAVSGAEHLFHELLRAAGITGWQANLRVADDQGRWSVVDVAFVQARLAVEIDGRTAHAGQRAFVEDRRRDNRLVAAGWRVLRFTWWDLVERPDEVIAQVRRMLEIAGR